MDLKSNNIKHRCLGFALSCLIFLTSCSGISSRSPNNPHNLCDIFSQQKGWKQAAETSSLRWGISVPIMMSIIYYESSFIADARPPYKKSWIPFFRQRVSTAFGYAQALDGTWAEYLRQSARLGAKRNNFADAIDFVGWYSHLSYKRSGISKLDSYRLYLAYHEGHSGYNRASYRKRPWLLQVASKVQERSQQYAVQLRDCRAL